MAQGFVNPILPAHGKMETSEKDKLSTFQRAIEQCHAMGWQTSAFDPPLTPPKALQYKPPIMTGAPRRVRRPRAMEISTLPTPTRLFDETSLHD